MIYVYESALSVWSWAQSNLDGSNQQPFFTGTLNDQHYAPAAWSPDGTKFIFYSNAVRVYNAATLSQIETIAPVSFQNQEGHAFTPDGQSLIYVSSSIGAIFQLFTYRFSDGHCFRLTDFNGNITQMTIGIRQ